MRLATFNIHHGTVGARGPVDPEQLAAVCASFDADLIALQEVDRDTYRTGRRDLAAIVAGACGMTHAFGASRWFPGGRYGNALLVRGTITDAQVTSLPRVPAHRWWQERRTALEAAVTIDGVALWAVCTHLAVPPRINAVQLDELLRHLRSRPRPQVVLGDLNRLASLVGPEAATAGLHAASHGATFPVHHPRRAIDHVLVTPELAVVAAEVRSTSMSDHAALLVDVDLAPATDA